MAITTATDSRYDNNFDDWLLIARMLTGEGAKRELVRGPYEATHAFKARKKCADFRTYTRDIVERLVGELFTHSKEVTRETVVSDDYLQSIGPEGESYHTQIINLAETLVAYHEAWALVDPGQGLRIVEPQHVTRSNSNAAIVKGTHTPTASIEQDEKEIPAWTVYYDNRWEKYVKAGESSQNEDKRVGSGFYYEKGGPILQGLRS